MQRVAELQLQKSKAEIVKAAGDAIRDGLWKDKDKFYTADGFALQDVLIEIAAQLAEFNAAVRQESK